MKILHKFIFQVKSTSKLSGDTLFTLLIGLETIFNAFKFWLTELSFCGEFTQDDCVVLPLPVPSIKTSIELGVTELSIT